MTPPRVSVMVLCYNDGRYLERSVQSVLRQTERSLEVLVLDNGSSDDTWSVTKSLAMRDRRVVPLRLDTNLMPPAAYNELAARAAGDWLLIHNADDWAEPDYVAAILTAATEDPRRNCIFSPWQWFGGREDTQHFPAFDPGTLATVHQVPGIRAVPREYWLASGGEDPAYPVGADWEWAGRCAAAGTLVPHQLARPYLHVRHHGERHLDRLSGTPWLMERARVQTRLRELLTGVPA